jgi:hypothetical protein
MRLVFLDEFGHIGPFVSRTHPKYKTSPVFGVSGFIMPEERVRHFSTWFYQLKHDLFSADIAASSRHESAWEKKGNEIFTSGHIYKTKKRLYSVMGEIRRCGGKLFYHGIQKYESPEESNPTGLYSTVLAHALHKLNDLCDVILNEDFMVILDEHNSRIALLENAMRAMYGKDDPVRRLIQPPFQVESHLYQAVQVADWISSVIGSLWAYRALPEQFADAVWAEKYFASRIAAAETHSSVKLVAKGPLRANMVAPAAAK